MAKPDLNLKIKDIVTIAGDLYVKTPKALEQLLATLQRMGYEIKDLRQDERRLREGAIPREMELNSQALWYVHLGDIRYGKCSSCKSYISVYGIQSHGHQCEACGAVTYYEIVDGSTIRFRFNSHLYDGVLFAPSLTMKAKRWDITEGYLYLYMETIGGRSLGDLSGEQARAYLAQHMNFWEKVEEDGQLLIRVRYPFKWSYQNAAIEPMEIYDHYWNHKIVKLWNGKEHSEWDNLDIPESLQIFETWHWAPLPSSSRLHERLFTAIYQVSDKGYYYQDGRPAFNDYHWREIGKFIRHFTTLDPDAYDRAWHRFRNSGPGGIDDLARFCHEAPQVQNQPNIGNALVGASKQLAGQCLTLEEYEAALAGDREFVRLLGYPSPLTRTLDVGKYQVSVTYNASEQIIRILVTYKRGLLRRTFLDQTLPVPVALRDLPAPRIIKPQEGNPDAVMSAVFRLIEEINEQEVTKGNYPILQM